MSLKLFKGFWLEEYIAEILLELKEENVIQEVFTSIERKKKGNSKAEFEVDFLVYNNFSIKCISVTTLEKYEEAKFKLYEVKLRAAQLAGDEARIVYMNLCEKSEKLKSDYKNTWQNDLKDTLIISYDNIAEFKEIIKEWLKGGVR